MKKVETPSGVYFSLYKMKKRVVEYVSMYFSNLSRGHSIQGLDVPPQQTTGYQSREGCTETMSDTDMCR